MTDVRPPAEVDGLLRIATEAWRPGDLYNLLNALVVPRPIAWVSTRSAEGVPNLAPHSYFTVASYDPPMVCFTSMGRKDTVTNLEQVGEFVVNIASRPQLEALNTTSAPMPPAEDEFGWADLARSESRAVSVPGVAEVPARLECVLDEIVPKGNGLVVFGRVVHIDVSGEIWADGRVDVGRLDPICRLAGSEYAVLGERIRRRRPTWEDLQS